MIDARTPAQIARDDAFTGEAIYASRHRALDTSIGRWTRQDPKGYVDGSNLHQYVSSNPITRTDWNGLDDKSDEVLLKRCRVFNETNQPILMWSDQGGKSDWLVLKPGESTPYTEDWDYGFYNGRWHKFRPSYSDAAAGALALLFGGLIGGPLGHLGIGDFRPRHFGLNFRGKCDGDTVKDLTKTPVVKCADGSAGSGWYPGSRPGDDTVPDGVRDEYDNAGGTEHVPDLDESQHPPLKPNPNGDFVPILPYWYQSYLIG